MKVTFLVDQNIAKGAKRNSTCECLVARALFKEGVRRIKVTKDSITGLLNGNSVITKVPPKLALIIENFDKGKKITQFSSTLNFSVIETIKRSYVKRAKRPKKRGVKKGSYWSKYRYQGIAQLTGGDNE
jgi:hypothetical protein